MIMERNWEISQFSGTDIGHTNFDLIDDGTLAVALGNDLIVEEFSDSDVRHFGGVIVDYSVRFIGVEKIYSITAQQWKIILEKSIFTLDVASQADTATITAAFSEAGVTEINTSTAGYVESARTLEKMSFRGTSLRSLMDTLTSITGWVWDVDNHKKLIYRQQERKAGPFNLSDAPDNTATFPFYNSSRIERLGAYNFVRIEGERKLSSNYTDIYSGDGSKKLFHLAVDNMVTGNEYHKFIRGPSTAAKNDVMY